MRNRRNVSDVFGIMWYGPNKENHLRDGNLTDRLRHECNMEDNLSYRWEAHNGVDYGSQIIEDDKNNLILNTKFYKRFYNATDNQSWSVSIKGSTKNEKNPQREVSLILYFAMENFEVKDKSFFNYDEEKMTLKAEEEGKEKYKVRISIGEGVNLLNKSYQKYRKIYNETWRVRKFVIEDLKPVEVEMIKSNSEWVHPQLTTNQRIKTPNVVAVQLTMQTPFEVIVNFDTKSRTVEGDEFKSLNEEMNIKEQEFNKKFDETFKINPSEFNPEMLVDIRDLAKQALSNLLGGIGYFWGAIKINLEGNLEPGRYHKGFRYAVEPKGLFSGTPSRSFFPRGFLWDEGFHNILISQWNYEITQDIIDSWLSTMSATGWMAREQIRGAEAESVVPQRFLIQDKLMGNPPTLIYPVEYIMNYYKFHSEDQNLKTTNNFLKKCFDKFSNWYEWYEIYQKSTGDKKSYQWYGRNSEHNLASGLDDYPRGMTPNIYERHLDLHLWVIELMRVLKNLSELFDYELVEHFGQRIDKSLEEVRKNYYDKEKELLNDYLGPQFKLIKTSKFNRPVPPYLWRGDNKCGMEAPNPLGQPSECNPYSDSPCCSEFGWCGNTQGHCNCPKCKKSLKLEERSDYTKENIFNPHLGYVNLYPIAFGILKTDDKIFRSTLKLLKESSELYSPFGIRSLSRSDLLYHTGDDYWRGNIWINLNFLVLKGLHKYYRKDPEAVEVYKNIRSNIINTVYSNWKETKTFYEQYSDIDGKGIRARPFNGWTSLILNIITEKYEN
jgi:mannosyl-oligosaccharide glucosidase